MNTGLPGTGIGGLFYLLSVIVMIFVEMKDILLGKRNGDRKRLMIEQTAIAVSLLISIAGTNVFFSKYVFKRPTIYTSSTAGIVEKSSYVIQNFPVIVPILLLTVVLAFTQIMYFVLKSRSRKMSGGRDLNS